MSPWVGEPMLLATSGINSDLTSFDRRARPFHFAVGIQSGWGLWHSGFCRGDAHPFPTRFLTPGCFQVAATGSRRDLPTSPPTIAQAQATHWQGSCRWASRNPKCGFRAGDAAKTQTTVPQGGFKQKPVLAVVKRCAGHCAIYLVKHLPGPTNIRAQRSAKRIRVGYVLGARRVTAKHVEILCSCVLSCVRSYMGLNIIGPAF